MAINNDITWTLSSCENGIKMFPPVNSEKCYRQCVFFVLYFMSSFIGTKCSVCVCAYKPECIHHKRTFLTQLIRKTRFETPLDDARTCNLLALKTRNDPMRSVESAEKHLIIIRYIKFCVR